MNDNTVHPLIIKLRKIREQRGLSRAQLTISQNSVKEWESGIRTPTLGKFTEWVNALGYELNIRPKHPHGNNSLDGKSFTLHQNSITTLVDLDNRLISVDGDLKTLSKLQWQIVEALIARTGKIVTLTGLHQLLYENQIDGGPDDKVFSVHIYNIRKKTGLPIDTVRSIGYIIRERLHFANLVDSILVEHKPAKAPILGFEPELKEPEKPAPPPVPLEATPAPTKAKPGRVVAKKKQATPAPLKPTTATKLIPRILPRGTPAKVGPNRQTDDEAIAAFLATKQITVIPSTGTKELSQADAAAPLVFDPKTRKHTRRVINHEQGSRYNRY